MTLPMAQPPPPFAAAAANHNRQQMIPNVLSLTVNNAGSRRLREGSRLTTIIDHLTATRGSSLHQSLYFGEGGPEGEGTTEAPKSRKRRANHAAVPINADMAEVKTERVSPAPSPSGANLPALKHMEQMMNRNYSDFMRSLAAKYNNSNPNEDAPKPSEALDRTGWPLSVPSYFSNARNGYLKTPFGAAAAVAAATPEAVAKGAKPAAVEAPQQAPLLLGHPGLGFPGLMDMSSTQALLSMVRSANLEQYLKGKQGPLDLSAAAPQPPAKKVRSELKSVSPKPPPRSASSGSASSAPGHGSCPSLCTERPCEGQAVSHWTVDDVCTFVTSIDICAEYAQVFRDQSIDGSTLPLLTEEHLTSTLGLKLGPALKLRSMVARRLGHCASCLHCVHCHGGSAAASPSAAAAPQPAASPRQSVSPQAPSTPRAPSAGPSSAAT